MLHTFWVSSLRLVLDAQLSPGKEHSSGHAKAALGRLQGELGERGPALVRGDCGYGNEDIIDVCEQRGKSYLLRLRKTANVKRLIERLFTRDDWTRATEASQGWLAIEDSLKLSGWSRARRVVVLRRRIKNDLALTAKKKRRKGKIEPGLGQLVLALAFDEVQDSAQMWEYTVLVSDVKYDLAAIGQLYRDHCDCRPSGFSGFDELKSQWGVGRLHHPGHAPQPGHGACGGADLQLVELVRARGQPAGPARSADQPAPAAGRCRARGQPRRPDVAVPHADARRSGID